MTRLFSTELVFATAGKTVDGRTLSEKDLMEIAEGYDPDLYCALINFNHKGGNYGDVISLRYGDHPKLPGRMALLGRISPNMYLLSLVGVWKDGVFLSIEYFKNFAGTKKKYLAGLAVTNHPASVGTSRMAFADEGSNEIFYSDFTQISGTKEDLMNGIVEEEKKQESFTEGEKEERTIFEKLKNLLSAETPKPENTFSDAIKVIHEMKAEMKKEAEKLSAEKTDAEKRAEELSAEKMGSDKKLEKLEAQLKELKTKYAEQQEEMEVGKNSLEKEKVQSPVFHVHADPVSALNEMFNEIREENGAQPDQVGFNVQPEVQQKLLADYQVGSNFLSMINMIMVDAPSGKSVLGSLDGEITTRGERKPKDIGILSERKYAVAERQFDWVLSWELMNNWNSKGDLKAMYSKMYKQHRQNELVQIALKGKERKTATKPENLLEVDWGFGALLDKELPQNVLNEFMPGSGVMIYGNKRERPAGKVIITPNADKTATLNLPMHGFIHGGSIIIANSGDESGEYQTVKDHPSAGLNAIVLKKEFAAKKTLAVDAVVSQLPNFATIDQIVQTLEDMLYESWEGEFDTEKFRVLFGRNTRLGHSHLVYNSVEVGTPSELQYLAKPTNEINQIQATKVNFFPENELWLVRPDNLSYYEQSGTAKREAKDDHTAKGWRDLNYNWCTNHIEDPRQFAVARNVFRLSEK